MADELDKLDPRDQVVKLRSGIFVRFEALRTRQFLKLLRIVTHGALPGMSQAGLLNLENLTNEEFLGQFLTITLLSIPDAEEETVDFIRSMVYPDGLIERKGLNKQDVERNKELWAALDEELENPDLDDLITIIEAVVRTEAEDIQALGKRLAAMLNLAAKTGQLSPNPKASTPASSAGSRGRTTSSRRSTAGPTMSSVGSALDDYDSASQPSGNASTTPVGSASIG